MTTAEAKAWFLGEISDFVLLAPTKEDCWKKALARREEAEHAEHWQRWIRLCCKGLRSAGVKNPTGLLKHRLDETSPADIATRPERPARAISNQTPAEAAEYKQRAVAARTERPPARPPLAPVMRLSKRLGTERAIQAMQEEWERQGCPHPQDFDPTPLETIQ